MKSTKKFRMKIHGSGFMAKSIFRMSKLFFKKQVFCILNKAIFSILYKMYEKFSLFGEVWDWNYEKNTLWDNVHILRPGNEAAKLQKIHKFLTF